MSKTRIGAGVAALALLMAGAATAQDAKPVCAEPTRACYLKIGRAYFDAMLKADGDALPLASDLRVTEQGEVLATSRAQFLPMIRGSGATKGFNNLRMLVDEPAGQVIALAIGDVRPDDGKAYSVRRIQRMRIVRGLITEVELVIYVDSNPAPLWPEEDIR